MKFSAGKYKEVIMERINWNNGTNKNPNLKCRLMGSELSEIRGEKILALQKTAQ